MFIRLAAAPAGPARFLGDSRAAARSAIVLPPAFWPSPRNDAAQLSAGPHGALLNHMSWPTLLFTWNEKLPISNSPRDLTSGMIGAVGTVAYGANRRSTLSTSSSYE